jgi:N-acetylneuraminic acid mutarotase
MAAARGAARNPQLPQRAAEVTGSPWANITHYPIDIFANAAATDPQTGDVYSAGGVATFYTGQTAFETARAYVYDPSTGQWSRIADLPQPLGAPVAGFISGKLYVAGGASGTGPGNGPGGVDGPGTGLARASVYVYDPSSGTWSQAASMPAGVVNAAGAVLGGDLYVIGGCLWANCDLGELRSVYRYDPGSNTWTQLASYPVPVALPGCAGIDGEVVCAGGVGSHGIIKSTYIYSPGSDTWFKGAGMPYTDAAMGYAGANGRLQVLGGITGVGASNQVSQYDPVGNTWTALPNLNEPQYWAGSSCGLYMIGTEVGFAGYGAAVSETLPGYSQCGPVSLPWLSAASTGFDVAPGQQVTVAVRLDSSKVAQPGTYTAAFAVDATTADQVKPVTITLTVKPPRRWGEITGTVTDAVTGNPVGGATVQISTRGGKGKTSYTVTTDSTGHYQWWLDARDAPLLVSAAKDGYQPQARMASISPGQATTLNFALSANPNPAGVRR